MTYLAAAVQRAPGLTLEDGVDKAVAAIEEAGREGASLIVFPETWIPSYPYYHGQSTNRQAFSALYQRTFENSIAIPGPEWNRIAQAAADAQAHVTIGVNEREPRAGTIYNTLAYIAPDGSLLGKHRKLVPTLTERLVWGYGDGSDLDVYDTEVGRLGGLICYEHQMAPARYALSTLGIQVHASVWPGWEQLHPVIDAATRHLAYENACYVIVARETMSPELLPAGTPLGEEPFWHAVGRFRDYRARRQVSGRAGHRRRNYHLRRNRPGKHHRIQALGRFRRPLRPPRRVPAPLGQTTQAARRDR